jgi:hypothetical protein
LDAAIFKSSKEVVTFLKPVRALNTTIQDYFRGLMFAVVHFLGSCLALRRARCNLRAGKPLWQVREL